MSLNLQQTLSWTRALAVRNAATDAELAMLNDLQGNILKGHGRHYTIHLLLAFDPGQPEGAREFVHELGCEATTALQQLTGATLFKATGVSMAPFSCVLLSAQGYQALGRDAAMPADPAFRAGMRARELSDPPPSSWDAHLAADAHAMVIAAVDSEEEQLAWLMAYQTRIGLTGGAVRLIGSETGRALFNEDGNGIEHFGYVDGRSQPLALQEDVDQENAQGGTDQWDPSIPLSQLLVPCPGGKGEYSCGSYFVFRKLEQNVRGFKRREQHLAELMDNAGERAGASVVGRFENGTPVTLHDDEIEVTPDQGGVPNNFNYSADAQGLKCPFAGHVRKANPRDVPGSKAALMARRGIPYGCRSDAPNSEGIENKPSAGVGLLFMAYQADLARQFETTQRYWANARDFPVPGTGIDPIIGQGLGPHGQRYPRQYGESLTEPFDFSGFVNLRGGEYFFAPSISFLMGIDA